MVWLRARKPEHREQRKQALLAAAAQLFEEKGFDQVSLNAIARKANISKANIYRYFEGREELFLHLLLEDYQEWIQLLQPQLQELTATDDEQAVARVISQSVLQRPRLAELMSVLTTVLERHITVELVVWFKTTMMSHTQDFVQDLRRVLPSLSADDSMQFIMIMYHLIASMWPAANPSPAVQEALKRPELEHACIDFEEQLTSALVVTIRGLRVGQG